MKYFLGLSAQYSNRDVLRHVFATGSEYDLSELRAFLAAHYGATYDHVAVYANGRTALNVAIKAITKRGGRVVITSLTCYAVVQAVKAAGCVPIFADVDPKTLHFGKKELEEAIKGESNVQAVIVQNNLGIPADIAGIEEVAKANKLAIIEDLAHCAGVQYADGREAGTVGRAVALSFGKGKSIDTVTGGAVIFTDPLDTPVSQPADTPKFRENWRARMYPFHSLVIRSLYGVHPKVGRYLTSALLRIGAIKRSADGTINSKTRLTYWQCRLALSQLQSLPHRGRKPIRDFYLVNDRETVLRKFELDGYFFGDIWYDMPVAPKRYFSKADFHADKCPIAAKLAQQIVNIPTYYEPAEMKSALKIIQRYSADDTEFEELKDEDNLTEAEKKAKIKAEKKARAKAKKAEKNKSTSVGGDNKEGTTKDSSGISPSDQPDTNDQSDKDQDNTSSSSDTSAKEEEKVKNSAKQAIKKVAKMAKSKAKSDKKSDDKTSDKKSDNANLSALEEKSSLLSAAEAKKTADKDTEKTEKATKEKESPEKTPAVKISAEKTEKTAVKKSEVLKPETKKTEIKEPETPKEESKSSTTKTQSKKEPVMRVAPKKLTEREKLKLELEKGRKDGPSVL